MTTDTDLANAALGLLGEMPITLITDVNSKPARVCNQFASAARIEVLRAMHLVESTAISSMDAFAKEAAAIRLACKIAVPLLGSQEVQGKMEQLYALRIQDAKVRILHSSSLNGKILAMIGNDLAKVDLSPSMLTEFSTTFQADATKEVLRLTHAVSEATLYAAITDSLILEAIDARHAAKIAGALTLPSTQALEAVAAARLQEGKTRALHSSALNGKILAMIGADLAKADLSPAMLTEFGTTYQADATKEVLRLTHAASEATLYAAITDPLMLEAIDTRQAAKIAAALTLPSTQALEELFTLRLQETKVRVLHTSALNGKVLAMIGNDLAKIDITPTLLTEFGLYQAEATKEVLRLTHAASEATLYAAITDPLVTEAIDVRQALKIASALTLPSMAALEQQFALRLQEAKVRVLHTSALNGKVLAMIGNDLSKIDISATMLTEFGLYQAETTKEVLRLTHAADETTLYAALTDTLLIEAIDVRQALKIATALTLPSAAALEQQFALRIQEARVRLLNSSAINGQILAMLGNDMGKFDLSPAMLTLYGVTYQAEATKEVLRLTHAVSEATAYGSITDPLMLEAIDIRHALKIATALTLPSAAALEQQFALRLQENKVRLLHTSSLNGKILAMIGNDLAKVDLSPAMLTEFGLYQAEATKEVLRLTHAVSEATLYAAITDPLILETIDTRQAAKISAALTLPSTQALEELFALRLQECKVRILHTSALNGKILAMIGNDLAKFDLSPAMLAEFSTTFQADASKEVLRLTHAAVETTAYALIADYLILEAIDARHAAKIAGAMALPSAQALEQVAAERLQECRVRLLHTSAINGRILAMIGNDLAKVDLSPAMLTEFSSTYQTEATKEVLRLTHAASEATLYAAITDPLVVEAIDLRHALKIATALTLPSAAALEQQFALRIQEARVRDINSSAINGQILAMLGNDLGKFDLSPAMLTLYGVTYQAEAAKEVLRLTHAVVETTAYGLITDPLLTEAIDIRHALKIATALTLPSAAALEQQFALRLQDAKVRILHTSAINGQILAMIGNDLAKADLSPTMLTEFSTTFQAEATKEVLRLTHAVSEATLYAAITDPLMIETIDLRHALKIATALTLPSAAALEQQFALRLQDAKVRILHSSSLNGKILAMIGSDLAKTDLSPSMLTEFSTTFQADATKEVLRLTHAASEATLYAAITDSLILEAIDARHAAKIAGALTLPSTQALEQVAAARLQECKVRILHTSALNGKILAMIGNDLAKVDLSPAMLTEFSSTYQTEATKEVLRLTHAVSEATAYGSITDPLIVEAIDLRHALKIATALTLPSAAALEQQFALRIQEARVRDINSSAINGQILAMLGNDLGKFDLSPAMLTLYGTTFQAEATKEVLRLTHSASEATLYAAITDPLLAEAIDLRHALKIATALTLPSAAALEQQFALRLQECKVRILHTSAINGRILAMIGSDLGKMDLSPTMMTELGTTFQTEATKEVLRLTHAADETTLYAAITDPLMIEAIDLRHALKIATALTLPSAAALEQQFALRLQENKVRLLHTSAINGQILAMIGNDLAKIDLSPSMLTLFGTTYAEEARKEVLRMGRWGCAIKRGALVASTAPTVGDYAYRYTLPATCLRVLEVNGEAVKAASEYFEIEGAFVLSNENTMWIRYVDTITLAACDPLVAQAVNTRHAMKVAANLALSSLPALEGLFQKRLAEARQHDAMENGSAEKPSWGRVFGRSRLLGARRPGRNPLRMEDF